MEGNLSNAASKLGFYLCWIIILSISGIYAYSTSQPRKIKILNTIEIPTVDPLIHVKTPYYVLPQFMYNFKLPDTPPNEELIEKSKTFYSELGTEAYFDVFYRPDFEQFPTITGLIFFFRISTFVSLAILFFLLSKFFKSGYSLDPFVPENHQRIFFVGLIFLLLPVLRILHSTVLAAFIRLDPKLLRYDISPSYQSTWLILVGLVIILGSFIYKELIRLHEEQKLTV